MKLTFVKHVAETASISSFYFEPSRHLRFTAGQFIELHAEHPTPDERGNDRWFTVSSPPGNEHITITTKFPSNNPSTFKQALMSLKSGDQVDCSSPLGDFVLPKQSTIPLVFVAAGIGCTPFHSILADLDHRGEQRHIRMLHKASNDAELTFKQRFERYLGKDYYPITAETGNQLDAKTIIDCGEVTPDTYIYLSGPEDLVVSLENQLKTAGINRRHIFTDLFIGYN